MGRLIDANALEKTMYSVADLSCSENIHVDVIADIIGNALTVDAVPVVHGRWQWISSTYDRIPCEKRYWCSKCHHETITHDSEPWEKFCPNCGAKMDGKDGDL